jgi:exodeoxyribonuclease-5
VKAFDGKKFTLLVDNLDDNKAPRTEVEVPAEFFTGDEKNLDWRVRKTVDEFTYGYALTVHKSQGSQWDNVLLFDESQIFRDQSAQHLYTAITRAAERVTVVV